MNSLSRRIYFAAIGAIALRSFVELLENVHNIPNIQYPLVALTAFVLTHFALAGPISIRASLSYAAIEAIIVTILYYFISLRFTGTDPYKAFNDPSNFFLLLSGALSWPFIIVYHQKRSIRDYDALHEAAWTIFIRGAIAFIFGFILIGVAELINALLMTVGVKWVDWFLHGPLDAEGNRVYSRNNLWLVYGFGFGIAAALTWEMQKMLSVLRFVLVRLLRILIPLLALAMLIFVPIWFLNPIEAERFESPTALLAGLLLLNATLIAVNINESSENSRLARFMDLAALILALSSVLLVPSMLSGMWARISEYGLTPERITATIIVCISAIYFTGYLIRFIMKRKSWKTGFEEINIFVALLVIVLGVMISTPILNPLRMSADSQIARIDEAIGDYDDYWQFSKFLGWGKAGEELLDAYTEKGDKRINTLIAEAKSRSRVIPEDDKEEIRKKNIEEIFASIARMPENSESEEALYKILNVDNNRVNNLSPCLYQQEDAPKCFFIIDPSLQEIHPELHGLLLRCVAKKDDNCNSINVGFFNKEQEAISSTRSAELYVFSESISDGGEAFLRELPKRGFTFEEKIFKAIKLKE